MREGAPAGANRSDLFHTIIGHYVGCGWDADQIFAHLEQYPFGIADKYLREARLATEIARSVGKYRATALPLFDNGGWSNGWHAKAPQPEPETRVPAEQIEDDPELQDDPELHDDPEPQERQDPQPDPAPDQEAPDLQEHDDDAGLDEDLEEAPAPNLPPMYAHGDPDPRPLKSWLVKGRIPACGHGLLSGQWGTYKSFVALELTTALMTAQPFLGSMVKRQCGVLFLAAEGADEMRLRLNAAVREKCGDMPRAPFRWYETAPVLLQKGAVEKLATMARQAEASLIEEFGLPLGLIIIDTIVVTAGYSQPGAENDPAVTQAIMSVLKEVAQQLNCFVLGVDHYGKDVGAGTRGSSAKEAAADVVLACLGDREQAGSVTNTRLAIRKCRGGPQGEEFYFTVRKVEDPTPDEDGDPVTTLVIDWATGPATPPPPPPQDPWLQCRRADQQIAVTRLKRVLMATLVEHGVDLPITPNGSTVHMIDREIIRTEFYAQTAADGTPAQKGEFRRKQFNRALDWTEQQKLIGIRELDGTTYLWLMSPSPDEGEGSKQDDL